MGNNIQIDITSYCRLQLPEGAELMKMDGDIVGINMPDGRIIGTAVGLQVVDIDGSTRFTTDIKSLGFELLDRESAYELVETDEI